MSVDYVTNVFEWYLNLDPEYPNIREKIIGNEKNSDLSKILEDNAFVHNLLLRLNTNSVNVDMAPILAYIVSQQIDLIPYKNNDFSYLTKSNIQYGLRLLSEQIARNNKEAFSNGEDVSDKFTNQELLGLVEKFNNKVIRSSTIKELYPIGPDGKQYTVPLIPHGDA